MYSLTLKTFPVAKERTDVTLEPPETQMIRPEFVTATPMVVDSGDVQTKRLGASKSASASLKAEGSGACGTNFWT